MRQKAADSEGNYIGELAEVPGVQVKKSATPDELKAASKQAKADLVLKASGKKGTQAIARRTSEILREQGFDSVKAGDNLALLSENALVPKTPKVGRINQPQMQQAVEQLNDRNEGLEDIVANTAVDPNIERVSDMDAKQRIVRENDLNAAAGIEIDPDLPVYSRDKVLSATKAFEACRRG